MVGHVNKYTSGHSIRGTRITLSRVLVADFNKTCFVFTWKNIFRIISLSFARHKLYFATADTMFDSVFWYCRHKVWQCIWVSTNTHRTSHWSNKTLNCIAEFWTRTLQPKTACVQWLVMLSRKHDDFTD